jgi:hypothetical protein
MQREDDLAGISTEDLLSRYEEACREELDSFYIEESTGRIFPDSAAIGKRKRLYKEIRRRAKSHDPTVLDCARRVRRDSRNSRVRVDRFYIGESSTRSPRSDEALPERPYARWTTKCLRKKCEELNQRIRALDERISHWRMLQGGLGNEPSPAYVEGRRWESERDKIHLVLIKRGERLAESSGGARTSGSERRKMVDAYIEEVWNKTGKRIARKDIWSRAGYKNRTEFERWEKNDPKHPNRAADHKFTQLLTVEKPHISD